MKKISKKIIAMLLCTSMLFSGIVCVNAASDSAKKKMKGSSSKTSYSCSMYWKNNLWDTELHADGTAKTIWSGANPYNADSIVHSNILSCTGVGSMSIGGSKTGPNMSASVSGHTATWTYTVQNTWKVDTTYNYYTKGLIAGWGQKMNTEATIQFGSSFYTFGTN